MNSAVPMQEEVRLAAGRRLLFCVAIWTALLTAILCALLPAGLPLTKTVGSAFSPSTTVVALRGRAEQVRSAVRLVKGDAEPATRHPLQVGHSIFIAPMAPAVSPPQFVLGSPFPPDAFEQPLPSAVAGQPYPRGPPVA